MLVMCCVVIAVIFQDVNPSLNFDLCYISVIRAGAKGCVLRFPKSKKSQNRPVFRAKIILRQRFRSARYLCIAESAGTIVSSLNEACP